MAVTLDTLLGTGNASATASCNMSTTATVAATGTIIMVAGKFAATPGTFSVAGGSLTWVQDHTVTSGSIRVSVFRAHAPSGLASGTTLTLTSTGGSNGDFIIGSVSYLGIDTTSTVTAFNGAAAATAAWSSATVAANSGDALIGGAWVDNGATSSSAPTGPAVERIDVNIAGQAETITFVDKLSVAGSDSLAGTWNAAGGHIGIGVAYKAAAAAAAADIPNLAMAPYRGAY